MLLAGVPVKTLSWDDLPRELGEIILGKVPLLRLAQIAHLGKDFQAAYLQRKAAVVTNMVPLQDLPVGPGPQEYHHDTLLREINMREQRRDGRGSWGEWADYPGVWVKTELPGCIVSQMRRTSMARFMSRWDNHWHFSLGGSFSVEMVDIATGNVGNASAHVATQIAVGLGCRWLKHTEVVLGWESEAHVRAGQVDLGLMLCTAMATPLRGFLADIARGPRYDSGRRVWANPMQSIILVLPKGNAWPNQIEEAVICDAFTYIVAHIGAKPSAAKIIREFGDGRSEAPRRLLSLVGGI
jgi:hypothetical protein